MLCLDSPPATGQNEAPLVYHLMIDQAGNITERLHANFMFVNGGRVKLPDRRNVLPGVSMDTVLEVAAASGHVAPHLVRGSVPAWATVSARACRWP